MARWSCSIYFRVSEAAIFEVVKNGIPGTAMPSSGLPDNEVWKIVAFIRNVRATASNLVVPGNVQSGMAVFTGAGGRSRCHMIRGQGGVLGPDLSSIGAQLNVKKLREALTTERPVPNSYRPVAVTTLEGESVSRWLASTADSILAYVAQAGGPSETIPPTSTAPRLPT